MSRDMEELKKSKAVVVRNYIKADIDRVVDFRQNIRDFTGTQERTVTLPWSKIAKYYSANDDMSVLETDSKEQIYVDMSYEKLQASISKSWSSHNKTLDLKNYTGVSVLDKIFYNRYDRFKDVFNLRSLSKDIDTGDALIVMRGFFHETKPKYQNVAFLHSECLNVESASERDFLKLKNFSKFSSNWDMGDLISGPYIETSKGNFVSKVKDALKRGDIIIDLTKDPSSPNAESNLSSETIKVTPSVNKYKI